MAENILKLRVDSQEYDNKLKRASDGLQRYIENCRKAGGTLEHLDDGVEDFTKALGNMGTVASGAKGKLNEMTKTFTDLSMEYKQLTDQEKAAPFGKALGASLDQLSGRIKQTKSDLSDITSELNGGSGGGLLSGKLGGMLQVAGGIGLTKLAGMGVGLASELGDAVKQGIELARQGEGIRIAFERLGRGDILQGLREATHGTVTDIELMKAAVKFNDFKLPVEELGTMLAFAQQKAKDTGQSVDYMVDSIVTGLGRKSLMILDNLGLSASEIRDRMKETGDMTKAVGAIIREQMQKAGDYVETAADRALKQQVSLQNKMEELGRKFAPVQEASNQLWTSMKIGILDIVGGPLARLLNGLTQAGQLKNAIADAGGSDRVTNDINKLKGSNYKDKVYTAMLNRYSREEQAARNNWLKAQKGGMGSVQIWKNQYDAATALRQEFQSRGSAVVNPIKIEPPKTTTTTTTTTGGHQQTEEEIIAEIEKGLLAGLQKHVEGTKAIEAVGPSAAFAALAGSQSTKSTSFVDAFAALNKAEGINPSGKASQWKLGKNGQLVEVKNKEERTAQEQLQGTQTMISSLQSIVGGIESLGIELPQGLSNVLGALQTITGILGAIQTMQQVGTWLGIFRNGGIVPHAANGYYVPGNNYSGDVTPVLANAGELILNRAAQNSIASQLSGGGMQNLHLTASVSGEDIILSVNNALKRRNKGEIATWR